MYISSKFHSSNSWPGYRVSFMESSKEIPVPLSLFCKHPQISPGFQNPDSVSEAPPSNSTCPFVLRALDLSSLITHQDIFALPHFLSSHSCIKNLASKSLLLLYYFFNTSWQILFHFGFLEIILDFKMLRFSGLKVQALFGARETAYFPLKFPEQSWWLSILLFLLRAIPLIKTEWEDLLVNALPLLRKCNP